MPIIVCWRCVVVTSWVLLRSLAPSLTTVKPDAAVGNSGAARNSHAMCLPGPSI
jgi:hypothetical protein